MAPGIDKLIDYDPPGAIGLVDTTPVLLLRFNEDDDTTRPQDDGHVCQDFDTVVDATEMPILVNATLGRGRQFDEGVGLAAADMNPGDTLLTRDATIQAVLSWDAVAQNAAGHPGVIVARGRGTSADEFVCWGLRIDVADVGAHIGLVRWFWQDVAGVDHVDAGAQIAFAPGKYTMVTATRRWVSSTEVALAYYAGDQLAGEVTSAAGSIGGGLTGTVQIGYRVVAAAPAQFLAGVVDELLVLGRELCLEELTATWLRITLYQPLGVQLFREMFDEDFPISQEPDSDAQLDIRMTGQALGFAAANIENMRANFVPQRSYGSVLADWEEAFQVTPAVTQGLSIPARRERVLAKARQQSGSSLDGLRDVLGGLLGGATVDQLQFLAFSNTHVDDFATIDPLRWDRNPSTSFTPTGSSVSVTSTIVDMPAPTLWKHMRRTVDGNAKQAHAIVKMTFQTFPIGSEAGLYFGDAGLSNYALFGVRHVGANLHAWTESIVAGASASSVDRGDTGLAVSVPPPTVWLHFWQTEVDGTWAGQWSATSATSGFSAPVTFTHPTTAHWAGIYLRTVSTPSSSILFTVENHVLRATFGTAPFSAYALLDQGLGFTPDVLAARRSIESIKHAFVTGSFVTRPEVVYGDPDNGYNTAPFGGY